MKLNLNKDNLLLIARASRVNQWLKNLVVFCAVIFSGRLFDRPELFINSVLAFIVFCLLSSSSYLFNDIKDVDRDRAHPVKRHRPIASGKMSIAEAKNYLLIFMLLAFVIALYISLGFLFLCMIFTLMHFAYSTYIKNYPVIDIFFIAASFMIRTFAGEVATQYHIPIWLLLTIFFMSLFVASVKRNAELVEHGTNARESLSQYNHEFLNFLMYTFSTSIIVSYSFYTYFDQPPDVTTPVSDFMNFAFPGLQTKKLMMITIPLVVYGVARYGQLLYTQHAGERPEKIVITDRPLLTILALWGIIVIILIYVL